MGALPWGASHRPKKALVHLLANVQTSLTCTRHVFLADPGPILTRDDSTSSVARVTGVGDPRPMKVLAGCWGARRIPNKLRVFTHGCVGREHESIICWVVINVFGAS